MALRPLYIIRNSAGNDYSHKVYWSVAGGVACYQHYALKNNLEYLGVFGVASVFWTLVELRLATSNTRQGKIQKGEVFGFPLNNLSAAVLRGCAEGGSLTLMGLIAADYFLKHIDLSTEKGLAVTMGVMKLCLYGMTVVGSPLVNGTKRTAVASKRNILDTRTLAVMFGAIGVLLWGLRTDRISETDKKRLRHFVAFDAAIGISWNFLAYAVGYRWLSRSEEEGVGEPSESPLDHFFGLVWDGAVEIAAMYSSFVVVCFAMKDRAK